MTIVRNESDVHRLVQECCSWAAVSMPQSFPAVAQIMEQESEVNTPWLLFWTESEIREVLTNMTYDERILDGHDAQEQISSAGFLLEALQDPESEPDQKADCAENLVDIFIGLARYFREGGEV